MGNDNSSLGHEEKEPYQLARSIHEFIVKNINGEDVHLECHRGFVCLIVNINIENTKAADYFNKFNRLLNMFENLHILAFPCDQFDDSQGSNSTILKFSRRHKAKFHLFEKVLVNGRNANLLWKFLKEKQEGFMTDAIKGDFTIFVVDKEGVPVERHAYVDPLDLVPELELFCSMSMDQGHTSTKKKYGNVAKVNVNVDQEEFVYVAKSRPQTKNPRPKNVKSKEKGDFDCPTCCERYGMQVYQCNQGHSSCKNCKSRGASCGICGQLITDMRNIALESLLAEVKSPCPNKKVGCSLNFKLGEMEAHFNECPFGVISCPLADYACSWEGQLSKIADHFKSIHPDNTKANVDKEMFLFNICNEFNTLQFLKIGNFNFLVQLKVAEAKRLIYMAVQMIGTRFSAAKWNYELQVYNKREPRRKYQFNDICSSHSTPIREIFEDSRCAVLPMAYAMTFLLDGCLNYKIFINRNDEEQQHFHRGARRKQPQ